MAYVDQNGLILIDDVEVSEDINKLKNAMDLMLESLEKINEIISINSEFKGDIAEAIQSSATELTNKINEQKEEVEAEIRYINEVVERYKTIDATMRDQINTTLTGDVFNNG